MAATSVLASEPAFDKQCEKVGLSSDWVNALKTNHVNSLGKLSYAVSMPGTPATDSEIQEFAQRLRPGTSLSLGDSAALKRLVFESQTLCIAELRSSVTAGEELQKKLPPAERAIRVEDQKKRLTGLPLDKGSWACAHSLYDRFATMREQEELRFIPPAECVTRDHELAGAKPPRALQLDANRSGVVIKDQEAIEQMALDSDHDLYQAMVRRALAMDLVGLASFDIMQRWIERLFETMSQSPAPGFLRVSRAQLLRADRQAFVELARLCNGSLKAKPDGTLPLDTEIARLHSNVEVTYFLLPIPGRKGSGKGKGKGEKRKRGETDGEEKPSSPKKPKLARDPIPEALKGCHSRTPSNKPICFNFNLGKCNKGSKCKFAHVCCKPGCYKPHPMAEHGESSAE